MISSELAEIRDKIDSLDIEILEKLNERLALVLQTKAFKPDIFDPEREVCVLDRVKEYAQKLHLIDSDFAERVFTELMKEGRRIQKEVER
jgi:chorismate mutase